MRASLCKGFSLQSSGSRAQASVVVTLGLSGRSLQTPQSAGPVVWLTGFVALCHVESSRTRDRTRVPCISMQILNHWTTRAGLLIFKLGQHFVVAVKFFFFLILKILDKI